MIDIHSHIIPGIDDGSKDIETTLSIFSSAEAEGIKGIFATSHYIRGRYENDFDLIKGKVKELNSIVDSKGINIKVFPGQEVMLDGHTDEYYREGIINGFNESKFILVEFKLLDNPLDALDEIYELKLLGLEPVLAHVERYVEFIKEPKLINEFINEKIFFQVSSGSYFGKYGKDVQKQSRLLIKNGVVDFLGGDTHTSNYLFKREYITEIEKINHEAINNALNNNKLLINMPSAITASKCTLISDKGFFKFWGR